MKTKEELKERILFLNKDRAKLHRERLDDMSHLNTQYDCFPRELWFRMRDVLDEYYNEHDKRLDTEIKLLEWAFGEQLT